METDIEITREEGESKGRYVAVVEGHEAETTYSHLGASTIIIDHTGMPDALRGRGVGVALVRRGVGVRRPIEVYPCAPWHSPLLR
ncbi:MAG: N-acetyltransferase [Sulfitobacter sp.]|jgi:predicted GNAT family acetyltransferase